jgi:hypothetical protein
VELSGSHSPALGTSAWPATRQIYYIPFAISEPFTIVKIFWINGTTSSGNVDAGVYDFAGTRLLNTGSTAQGTVSVVQEVDVTDTTLPGPARYYLALTLDNTTGTIQRTTCPAGFMGGIGVLTETTGSFGLPSTATFSRADTDTNVFMVGLSSRTLAA